MLKLDFLTLFRGRRVQVRDPTPLSNGGGSPSPAIPPNSTLVFEVELLEIK